MKDRRALTTLAHAFLTEPGHPAGLGPLRTVLESIDPTWLKIDDLLRRIEPDSPWASETLFDDPSVHLALFVIPNDCQIPLHDHPDMHGLIRVVRGRMRVSSFDWVDRGAHLARPYPPIELTPGAPCIELGPERRNLHRLEGVEDCAFLDLFVPYYSAAEGRVCGYYHQEGEVEVGSDSLTRLRYIGGPDAV